MVGGKNAVRPLSYHVVTKILLALWKIEKDWSKRIEQEGLGSDALRTEPQDFERVGIKDPRVRRLKIKIKRPLKSRLAVVVGLLTGERVFLQKEAPGCTPGYFAALRWTL